MIPACYLLAALLLTWRLWADPASRAVAGNPTDADLFAWYLRYAALAVRHGGLPALVSSAMNAPQGVNMMWNTSLLLPGVVLAPVTLLLGPQVSLTVLTTAGFAGSATALFAVARRWRLSTGAAALAGAVYGFSPAMLHSSIGHYNLQFAVLPPLIVDAGLRLAAGRPDPSPDSGRPESAVPAEDRAQAAAAGPSAARGVLGAAGLARRWFRRIPPAVRDGAWLGLLIAAQVFISEELALLTVLTGVLLIAGLAAARPLAAVRRAAPAAAGLVTAAAVCLALAGHALRTQFHGPLTQHGPLFPPDYYVNDPTSFVNPSAYLLFHTAGTAATAARYQGGSTEYLAYLGWPLIVALAFLVVFSLGGHPLVGGHLDPAVDLPWHWLEEHALLSSVLPDRLSIVADGVAAVLLALGVDAVLARLGFSPGRPDEERPVPGRRAAGRAAAGHAAAGHAAAGARVVRAEHGAAVGPARQAGHGAWVVLAVAVAACLPLLPRPLPAAPVTPLPAGWLAAFAALHLRPGSRVLVVPVPANILTAAMRWQADTGEPTSMAGGYFIGPGAQGQAYIGGTGVRPTAWYLDRLWAAGLSPSDPLAPAAWAAGLPTSGPSGPPSAGHPPQAGQLRSDFVFWRPDAVVAVTAAGSPLGRYLTQLLGRPTVRSGRVLAWRTPALSDLS